MPPDQSITLRASNSDVDAGVPPLVPCFPSVVPPWVPLFGAASFPAGDRGVGGAVDACVKTATGSWLAEGVCSEALASRTCGSPTNEAEDSALFLAGVCAAVPSVFACRTAPPMVSTETLCETLNAGSLVSREVGSVLMVIGPDGRRSRLTGTPVRSLASGIF